MLEKNINSPNESTSHQSSNSGNLEINLSQESNDATHVTSPATNTQSEENINLNLSKEDILTTLKPNITLQEEVMKELIESSQTLKEKLLVDFIEEIKVPLTDIATVKLFAEPYLANDGRIYEEETIDQLKKSPQTRKELIKLTKVRPMQEIIEVLVKFFPSLAKEIYQPDLVFNELRNSISHNSSAKVLENNKNKLNQLNPDHIESLIAILYSLKDIDSLLHFQTYFSSYDDLFNSYLLKSWPPFSNAIQYSICHGKLHSLEIMFTKFNSTWNNILKKGGEYKNANGKICHYSHSIQLSLLERQYEIFNFLIDTIPLEDCKEFLFSPVSFLSNDAQNKKQITYIDLIAKEPPSNLIIVKLFNKHPNLLSEINSEKILHSFLYYAWVENLELVDRIYEKSPQLKSFDHFLRICDSYKHHVFYSILENYKNKKQVSDLENLKKIKTMLGDNFEKFLLQRDLHIFGLDGIGIIVLYALINELEITFLLKEIKREYIVSALHALLLKKRALFNASPLQIELILNLLEDDAKTFFKNSDLINSLILFGNEYFIKKIINLIGYDELIKCNLLSSLSLENAISSSKEDMVNLVIKLIGDNLGKIFEELTAQKTNILEMCCSHGNAKMLNAIIPLLGENTLQNNLLEINKIRKLLIKNMDRKEMNAIVDTYYFNSDWFIKYIEKNIHTPEEMIRLVPEHAELIQTLDDNQMEILINIARRLGCYMFVFEVASKYEKYVDLFKKSLLLSWGKYENIMQYLVFKENYCFKEFPEKFKSIAAECILMPLYIDDTIYLNLFQAIVFKNVEIGIQLFQFLSKKQRIDVLNAEFNGFPNIFTYVRSKEDKTSIANLLSLIHHYPNLMSRYKNHLGFFVQFTLLNLSNLIDYLNAFPHEIVKDAIKLPLPNNKLSATLIEHILKSNDPNKEKTFYWIANILKDDIKEELLKTLPNSPVFHNVFYQLLGQTAKGFTILQRFYTAEEIRDHLMKNNGALFYNLFLSSSIVQIDLVLNTLFKSKSEVIEFLVGLPPYLQKYNIVHIAVMTSTEKLIYTIKLLGPKAREACMTIGLNYMGNILQTIRQYGNVEMLKMIKSVLGEETTQLYYSTTVRNKLTYLNRSRDNINRFAKEKNLEFYPQQLIQDECTFSPVGNELISSIGNMMSFWLTMRQGQTSGNTSTPRKRKQENEDNESNKRQDFGKRS